MRCFHASRISSGDALSDTPRTANQAPYDSCAVVRDEVALDELQLRAPAGERRQGGVPARKHGPDASWIQTAKRLGIADRRELLALIFRHYPEMALNVLFGSKNENAL